MGKRMPSKWLTLIAACFGLLMLYIDLFIVNVALPTIGHDFRAPLGTVSWTISGYVLMIGVLPMGIGRLGDLWGQRAVYLAGVTFFSIASLLVTGQKASPFRDAKLCRKTHSLAVFVREI